MLNDDMRNKNERRIIISNMASIFSNLDLFNSLNFRSVGDIFQNRYVCWLLSQQLKKFMGIEKVDELSKLSTSLGLGSVIFK